MMLSKVCLLNRGIRCWWLKMCFTASENAQGRICMVCMFVLALAFSKYPTLGILKKTCPVPSSVHCPIVFYFPHWQKWKRNRHKHPIVNYEICTGNTTFSQNRLACVMARRGWAGREPPEPFRLQRCVLHFQRGAEATGLWVFSIICM